MIEKVKFHITFFICCLLVSNPAMATDILFEQKAIETKSQMCGGIIRDSDGFLWIGSVSGIFRYDGYELKKYESCSGIWIVSIIEDKDGILWIGTHDGGVSKYDKKSNIWTCYKHDPEDRNSISSNVLPYANQSLFEDKSGALWIATENDGLDKLDKKTDAWTHYRHHPDDETV